MQSASVRAKLSPLVADCVDIAHHLACRDVTKFAGLTLHTGLGVPALHARACAAVQAAAVAGVAEPRSRHTVQQPIGAATGANKKNLSAGLCGGFVRRCFHLTCVVCMSIY
jgi:hypothetical protein